MVYDAEKLRDAAVIRQFVRCQCGWQQWVSLQNLNAGTNPYLFPPVALRAKQVTCPNCRATYMVAG